MEPKANTSLKTSSNTKENPQIVGLTLTLHHETMTKGVIALLSSHCFSVSYNRTMLLETSLANAGD